MYILYHQPILTEWDISGDREAYRFGFLFLHFYFVIVLPIS